MGSAWCLVSVSPLWMLSLLPVPLPPPLSSPLQTLPGHPLPYALHTLQGTVASLPPGLGLGVLSLPASRSSSDPQ